jgi:ribosomal protein S18 acetylase RimI-like enzyme
MLSFRPIDLEADRDFILDMHCLGNYESETPWARATPYRAYREAWLTTPQPASFVKMLCDSIDRGAIAEIWEEAGKPAGFLWLSFNEIEGYGLTVAELNDIEVAPERQRVGIGTIMLQHAEDLARERGAKLLRSETGVENVPSQGVHEKAGFKVYGYRLEKRLEV